jgi:hypothetical protein
MGLNLLSRAPLGLKTYREGQQQPAQNALASILPAIPQSIAAESATKPPFPEFVIDPEPARSFSVRSAMDSRRHDGAPLAESLDWDSPVKDPRNGQISLVLKILMDHQVPHEMHVAADRDAASLQFSPQPVKP